MAYFWVFFANMGGGGGQNYFQCHFSMPKAESTCSERTPWGGGKKRGVEDLTNDAPPKTGFWTPPRTVRFPPPSGCQCSVFPVQKSTTEQTRSSFGGSKNFRESAFSSTFFLPPYILHPPISPPNMQNYLLTRNHDL